MSILSLVPTTWIVYVGGIALAGAGLFAGVQTYRLSVAKQEVAEQKLVTAKYIAMGEAAARKATEDNLVESQRRIQEQSENLNENQRLVSKVTAVALDNAAIRERVLRNATTVAASSCPARSDTPAPSTSAADRLAHVFGECTARLVALGKAADNAISRGYLAESDYDALEEGYKVELRNITELQAKKPEILTTTGPEQIARLKKVFGFN